MRLPRWLSPTSRVRLVGDALWLVAFALALAGFLGRRGAPATAAGGVALQLPEGGQRKALRRGGVRIGTLVQRARRVNAGWQLEQRFSRGGQPIGEVALELAEDLSLLGFRVHAELAPLAELLGGEAAALLGGGERLRRLLGGALQLRARCDPQSGVCRARGRIGDTRISRTLPVGRGPVLASAVYPLLARGVLGRKAELQIFDPLAMSARTVTFDVAAERAPLRLRSGSYRALRVIQDAGPLQTTVWLDDRGRALLEELPWGVRVEHEAWED